MYVASLILSKKLIFIKSYDVVIKSFHSIHNVVDRGVLWEELAAG